ncbi:hypothetical protein ACTFIV_009978 [Dictyostelium citrinum]
MSSSVSKVLRLTRASMIAAPKRSIAFRGDEFKEREEAFETQYVKQKEREDLKRMKKQEEAKKTASQPTSNSSSTNNSKAAKIKEIEEKISKLQKELADLKK